ncbi:Nucleotidylyl transferase [Penicillium soppii]|jgi:hypothetical protein|uniref:Nucleotidylyl transferase n=1 Tax=Penicillium soppii TaxID=69789 RepID=UPI002549A6B6|nr:Nucleotidylyl transferase [Penicillium soppii]KAJ5874057.1 Nucleotidylyl transferase [Penicillium soppii]
MFPKLTALGCGGSKWRSGLYTACDLPLLSASVPHGTPSIKVLLKDETEPTMPSSFKDIVSAYKVDRMTPQLSKKVVEEGLIKPIEPLRVQFEADLEWQIIALEAYTDLAQVTTKVM